MIFRTEIDIRRDAAPVSIGHEDGIFMLGSCFTDNVGALLEHDGFNVAHNPMGPLYNPCSIAKMMQRMCDGRSYAEEDLIRDDQGIWHCLDFASRYQHADAEALCDKLNVEMAAAAQAMAQSDVVIITLGTAFVYEWKETAEIVGNCHKFQPACFNRRMISTQQAMDALRQICGCVAGKRLLFTVSPIRHAGDGLHANQLSKATLLLAIKGMELPYFPAYEIMLDDLRDYRFYAADMKHPSDVAVEYIYEKFSEANFNSETIKKAKDARAQWRKNSHRQIII